MKKNNSQAGFTLFEVLLAILLVNGVLLLAINLFSQGQLTYTKAQDKVDAQSQLRIAMNHVKHELSVAIDIEDDEEYTEISAAPGSFEEGSLYYYVAGNVLVLNDPISGIEQVCQPLPGLTVTFSISPHDSNKKMLRVKMTTTEGAQMSSDILIQNLSSGIKDLTDGTEGSGKVLKFNRIN